MKSLIRAVGLGRTRGRCSACAALASFSCNDPQTPTPRTAGREPRTHGEDTEGRKKEAVALSSRTVTNPVPPLFLSSLAAGGWRCQSA